MLASLAGEVFNDLDGDGQRGLDDQPAAAVRVYLDANDNQSYDDGEQFADTDAMGQYTFSDVVAGDHVLRVMAPSEQVQTSPTTYIGTGYTELGDGTGTNPTQLFEMSLTGDVRAIGSPTADRIHDLVRTDSGQLIGFNFENDTIYTIDGVTGQETALATSSTNLVGGLAYDPASDTIYTLARTAGPADEAVLHTVDPSTGELGAAIGSPLAGLEAVSDLTFDTTANRIVGFDNSDNQFFEFQTYGIAQVLSTASRDLNSWSLAFNGTSFVMFDQDDPERMLTVDVNPDTGDVADSFVASQRLPVEGLFHAKRGDVAYRRTLDGSEDLTSLDFGLTTPDPVIPPRNDYPLVINEILAGFFLSRGDHDRDQALEFRGAPGGQIDPNTYFVIVEEQDNGRGEIHGIFDLSNQPLGSNGFLVLLQQDSIHTVDPNSAVLQSTAPGFGGLPGDIYTDSHPLSDRIDFILGANGYFLIQSDVAPQLGDDIDANDDGVADPDGVKSNWNVLDSVSLHPEVFSGSQAYGQILYAEEFLNDDPTTRTVEPGTPIVVGEGFGYAGRIGDSLGSDPDDWVFGSVAEAGQDIDGRTNLFELDSGFFGHPEPDPFHRRDLDHFGGSNFVGGVRGTIDLAPGLGETDADGNPIPVAPAVGLTVLADTNGNGLQDTLMNFADPDQAVDFNNRFDVNGNEIRYELTNAFPGVTVMAADSANEPTNQPVVSGLETDRFRPTFFPNYLFTSQGIDTWSSFRRLRFDFYRPVSEASIVAIGSEFSFLTNLGVIEAYDANDQLIDSDVSGLLFGQRRETITVESAQEDIAYVIAYSDDTQVNSTSGRFDRFTFKQSEATAVTDDDGFYEIKNLFPGVYDVSVMSNTESAGLIGRAPETFQVTRYENYLYNDTQRPNASPEADDVEFIIDENLPTGTSIGFVEAVDFDQQQLRYEILQGQESGLLIDEDTGELTVGPNAAVDFEQTPTLPLIVGVSDPLSTTTVSVMVQLNDLNEAPVVIEEVFSVAEDAPAGTAVGQIEATEPDFSQDQVLSFQAIGGSGFGTFEVDAVNGLVTLVDPDAISFEDFPELLLQVRVSDNATPALFTDVFQRIEIIDQNDAPTITSTQFLVAENSTAPIGQLRVADPDVGQTHAYEVRGGSGADVFEVSRAGLITLLPGVELDYEQTNSYTLEVVANDSGSPPLAGSATVTIDVGDVNETPLFSESRVSVPENSPAGTLVTTLVVVDPENSGSNYSVAMLDQGDVDDFVLEPSTLALTVAEDANLNFEIDAVKTLVFEITDPTGVDPVARVTLAVDLLNQNDAPIVTTREVVLSELAVPGTIVGTVEVQILEPDNGDVVVVEIVGGNAADRFVLDPNSRILRVAPGATFDADGIQDPLTIDVKVTDQGDLSSVGTIDVTLNNVNEPPIFLNGAPPSSVIVSGEPYEYVIPAGSVVDPEGGEFSLAVFDSNRLLPDWLTFSEETGTLAGIPDPTDVGTYSLTLRAFEEGPLYLFRDVFFTVQVDLGTTPLTNQGSPLDVDANGQVASLDALRIINYMDRYGVGASVFNDHPFSGFVDTSGDGKVTSLDALMVINGLSEPSVGLGELIAGNRDDRETAVDEAILQLDGESTLF